MAVLSPIIIVAWSGGVMEYCVKIVSQYSNTPVLQKSGFQGDGVSEIYNTFLLFIGPK